MNKTTEELLKQVKPCKFCKGKPVLQEYQGGLYYLQCKCNNWDTYQFVGANIRSAIYQWDLYNDKIIQYNKDNIK